MRIQNKFKNQWQYKLILRIEALSKKFQKSRHKNLIKNTCIAFVVISVLWGMFLVPQNILQTSQFARSVVEVTTKIFPWFDDKAVFYGLPAEKFVYLQCVYFWIFLIPIFVWILRVDLFANGSKNAAISQWIFALILLQIFLMTSFFLNAYSTSIHTTGYIDRQDRMIISGYGSAITAVIYASMCSVYLIEMVIVVLNLIHFFRKNKFLAG